MKKYLFFYFFILLVVIGCSTSSSLSPQVTEEKMTALKLTEFLQNNIPQEILCTDSLIEIQEISKAQLRFPAQIFFQKDRFYIWEKQTCFPAFPHLGKLQVKSCHLLDINYDQDGELYIVCENELGQKLLICLFKVLQKWHMLAIQNLKGEVKIEEQGKNALLLTFINRDKSRVNAFLVLEKHNLHDPLRVNVLNSLEKVDLEILAMPLFSVKHLLMRKGCIKNKKHPHLDKLIANLLYGKKVVELDHINHLSPAPIFILYPLNITNFSFDNDNIKRVYGWKQFEEKDGRELLPDEVLMDRAEKKQRKDLKHYFPTGIEFYYYYDHR